MRLAVLAIDHSMQMRCRILDIKVLVLARPAFRGKHATTVDVDEVPVGKFVPSFGMRGLFLVDAEMPFSEFLDPVSIDKVVLLLRRRLVLAPCVSFIEYKPAANDEFLRMVESAPV